MLPRATTARLAQVLLLVMVGVALVGVALLSSLEAGRIPPLQQVLLFGTAGALVIENGPLCVPAVALANCHTRVHQVFRMQYYYGNTSYRLFAYTWRK